MKHSKSSIVQQLQKVFSDRIVLKEDSVFYRDIPIIIPEDVESIDITTLPYKSINIYQESKIEFLIYDTKKFYSEFLSVEDCNLKIETHDFSDAMALHLLFSLPTDGSMKRCIHRAHRLLRGAQSMSIYDLIRGCLSGYYSITIQNKREEKELFFEKIAIASLFNFSMLRHVDYVLVSDINEVVDNCLPKVSSIQRKNLDVPHLFYNEDLVQYYVAGDSAGVPKIKFLAYYNVIEYYFDKKYYDELCKKIQSITIQPEFNHAKLNHYKPIVDIFSKKKNNFNEKELLLNLINEFIDLNELKIFLSNNPIYINENAYKIANTKFSLSDTDNVLKQKLQRRIYGVRNAIVHSKESESERYMPIDEKHIKKEIALVRYVAEKIIIGSAEITR